MDIINARKDAPDCPPELRVFAGRRIVPVLAGRIFKPISKTYTTAAFMAALRREGVSLLLPNGSGLNFVDASFRSMQLLLAPLRRRLSRIKRPAVTLAS